MPSPKTSRPYHQGATNDGETCALRGRVAELGGHVLTPPTDDGLVTRALVADPAGNALSLVQNRPSSGR